MKKIFFFLYALVGGFILIGLYFRFTGTKKPNVEIKIPFIGSQFSLENAPSQSLKGKIISMSGEVDWQSRVATESSKLNTSTQLQQGENITTGPSGNIKVQFGNGAEISLLPKTKIEIIQTLADNIVFNQISGIVVYKKTANYPLSIRAMHLLAETEDAITISIDNSIVTLESTSGNSKIAFNDANNKSQVIIIPNGSSYIFNDDTRIGVLE